MAKVILWMKDMLFQSPATSLLEQLCWDVCCGERQSSSLLNPEQQLLIELIAVYNIYSASQRKDE